MAFSKEFERELNRLFRERTHWLRSELGVQGAGQPPQFGRKKVDRSISRLQMIASAALAYKLAKAEFEAHVTNWKNYQIKGWGPRDKRQQFETWFDSHFRKRRGLVYAFWNRLNKCIYIGRTGPRGSRPASHFDKHWFSAVTRVTIYSVKAPSHVPKLECLAIHRFRPKRNQVKASAKKWTKACPLCTTHRYIDSELRSIFRFR